MYRQSEKPVNNTSWTCPHNVANLGPLKAEIGSGVWGTPANFNKFRVLPSLLKQCRSPEANQTLCTVFDRVIGWSTVCIFSGTLAADGILPRAKFTLRPTLAFSYIGSVTARHSSSGRQPTFATWYKKWNGSTELSQRAPPIFGWAAIMLGIGPHSSY